MSDGPETWPCQIHLRLHLVFENLQLIVAHSKSDLARVCPFPQMFIANKLLASFPIVNQGCSSQFFFLSRLFLLSYTIFSFFKPGTMKFTTLLCRFPWRWAIVGEGLTQTSYAVTVSAAEAKTRTDTASALQGIALTNQTLCLKLSSSCKRSLSCQLRQR